MFRRILLVFLLVLGISFAATAVTECMTINTPGYYVMTGDIINNTAAPCIDISSSDVVFDCGYHYLEAQKGAIYSGIVNPHNITIANCSVYSRDDSQIVFKGAGQDFHFLNLKLNGSAPSIAFIANDSTIENMNISLNESVIGTAAIYPNGNNLTVTNVIIELTHASQKGIAIWSNLYNSTFEHFEISGGATGIEVGPRFPAEDCTFRDITITNMSSHGVYTFADSEIIFDGLSISDAKWGIYFDPFANVGLEFYNVELDDCAQGIYSEASGMRFENLTISDATSGIYFDTGDNRFSNVDINATDLGIQVDAPWTEYNSFDGMNIRVSDPNGVGINLTRDRYSNYTNGDISGGEYCIWTYFARDNNTYADFELHDCGTGFLLSNGIVPTSSDYTKAIALSIYDVLLEYDISDFWYPVLFEEVYLGDNAGGIGLEFLTYGCINLENVAQPAPLPVGYNEFHGNYLEVTEFDSTRSCTIPSHYGFMNQTSFLWTAAQQAGYDMSTLKVLKWGGRDWIELPSRLNLTDRSIEVGDLDHFSIFTLTADVAEGGNGNGGTKDKGDITLIVPAEIYVLEQTLIQTFDDHGDPLNAKVTVKLGDETIFYGFVGMDGEVEVTPLLQGNYTVTAAKDNYDSPPAAYFMALLRDLEAVAPESVGENEQFEILVTSEGVLLEGARAEIDNLVRVTGADGTTTFTLSSAGNYGVEVTKAGYETWSGTMNVWAEGEEPEEEEGAEEEGIIIVDGEAEEETPSPPIVQGEVPSVDSLHRPLTEDQMRIQEHWLWMVLLLLLVVAAIAYWFSRKHKK